jgi:hypothetical protein
MTRVTLDIRVSVDENAQRYFEAAKRARKKARGAERTLSEWRRRAEENREEPRKATERHQQRKLDWYEHFRWCFSSDGFLLVAGRDASTNELLIKRHTVADDIVFHTDMAGSPFVIVKAEGKAIPAATMEEAAQFCAVHSRAWRNGMSSLEVFHVAPAQVTKEANPGEYLSRGAFMIRGRTIYHKPLLRFALGLDREQRVIAGPPTAVQAQAGKAIEILQGNEKASDVAKQLHRLLGAPLDEIIRALPPGGCKLGKPVRTRAHPRASPP